jgi:uncharacterized membrane protein
MIINCRTVRANHTNGARVASTRRSGWHTDTGRDIIRFVPVHSDLLFYTCALVLGLVAGMRSMLAPAVLAITLARRPEYAPASAPAQWFTLLPLAVILAILALGELVADKLPMTPNRTALGPFVARLASGAISGAVFVQIGHLNPWLGAACGAIGAFVGTFGAFHARRFVARATGIRDPFIGAAEDVVAIALAAIVVATLVG